MLPKDRPAWPVNFAMALFEISKEEFQHPETIDYSAHTQFCNLASIEKFKRLTAERVVDLFQNDARERRMKKIIISYYKDGRTHASIGYNDLGITPERVRQIKAKALNILLKRIAKVEI